MEAQEFAIGLFPGFIASLSAALGAIVTLLGPRRDWARWAWAVAFIVLMLLGMGTTAWHAILIAQKDGRTAETQARLGNTIAAVKGEVRALRTMCAPQEETRRFELITGLLDRSVRSAEQGQRTTDDLRTRAEATAVGILKFVALRAPLERLAQSDEAMLAVVQRESDEKYRALYRPEVEKLQAEFRARNLHDDLVDMLIARRGDGGLGGMRFMAEGLASLAQQLP